MGRGRLPGQVVRDWLTAGCALVAFAIATYAAWLMRHAPDDSRARVQVALLVLGWLAMLVWKVATLVQFYIARNRIER